MATSKLGNGIMERYDDEDFAMLEFESKVFEAEFQLKEQLDAEDANRSETA